MSISDEDSAHDASDTFDSAIAALRRPAPATAHPDGQADNALREKASHVLDEASVDVDRVVQRGTSTVDTGLGALTAAFSRAQATYARNPKKTVLMVTAVALGISALAFLARRL